MPRENGRQRHGFDQSTRSPRTSCAHGSDWSRRSVLMQSVRLERVGKTCARISGGYRLAPARTASFDIDRAVERVHPRTSIHSLRSRRSRISHRPIPSSRRTPHCRKNLTPIRGSNHPNNRSPRSICRRLVGAGISVRQRLPPPSRCAGDARRSPLGSRVCSTCTHADDERQRSVVS